MKCTNKTAKPPFQTILVVACALILTQCSKLPTEPEVLPKEAEITGLHGNNLHGTQALASATTSTCIEGKHSGDALYRICVPEPWNGDLVVWAHGYVAPHEPLRIPEDAVDGTPISDIVNQLGFAFATTSFSVNGLAIRQGIADVVDLVEVFVEDVGQRPGRVYLVGGSEGGLITALAVEQFPNKFSGGLAACGPVGSFRKQINDFRLNREIQRFSADQAALDEIEAHYQTSGQLDSPVVTLHTTGDPIVPYWHEPLYRLKVFLSGSSAQHTNIPIFRYGHCNFQVNEVLAAFAVLV